MHYMLYYIEIYPMKIYQLIDETRKELSEYRKSGYILME